MAPVILPDIQEIDNGFPLKVKEIKESKESSPGTIQRFLPIPFHQMTLTSDDFTSKEEHLFDNVLQSHRPIIHLPADLPID